MLDRRATLIIRPLVQALAGVLVRAGWHADAVTWVAFALGIAGAAAIAQQQPAVGLVLILLSRLGDALDGAVARATRTSDRGAFLDIALDFVFYASVPLAFAVADPTGNALAAAALLAAFVGTGSSFLAFAVIAGQRGLSNPAWPDKSIYFLGGLTEATETLACFAAMCLWPQHFATLAWLFAGLCLVTTVTRLRWGWKTFGETRSPYP